MRADHTLVPLRSRHLYEFADLVHANILSDETFSDDVFGELLEDDAKLARPHRDTLLHDVIRGVLGFYLDYSTGKVPELEIERYRSLLAEAGIPAPSWLQEDCVRGHIGALDALLGDAAEEIVPSIFHVLFSDRQVMLVFQKRVAAYVGTLKRDNHPAILIRNGILKRPQYLPSWLKAGVFHRDRGRCQSCYKDLSGLGRPIHDLALDHIIPLAAGGSNDPTNFQLLCADCNWSKGKRVKNEPPKFAPYW
jgi:hypothetical protein